MSRACSLSWRNCRTSIRAKVVAGLDAALETLRQGLPGVEINSSIYRSTSFLETATDNVSKALMIGAALLVIALLFLFYEWRAAIISAIAVLLSMLTAALVLKFYGATINIMVLAGLSGGARRHRG